MFLLAGSTMPTLQPRTWLLAIPLLASLTTFTAPPILAQVKTRTNPWASAATPSPGPVRILGSYVKGCIGGAHALPRLGANYIVLRPARNRYWGHPDLIAFVQDLARIAVPTGRVLLIADLAQPRGGPVKGHASHQIGLDGDIRLHMPKPAQVTRSYLRNPPHVSMLNDARTRVNPAVWGLGQIKLLKTAARDFRIDRIFVHPAIKKALCRQVRSDRGWLNKVVPWYGHEAHMHVRLRCPKNSGACVAQKAIPPGEGCDRRLAWWFKVKRPIDRRKRTGLRKRLGGVYRRLLPWQTVQLPGACKAVLER